MRSLGNRLGVGVGSIQGSCFSNLPMANPVAFGLDVAQISVHLWMAAVVLVTGSSTAKIRSPGEMSSLIKSPEMGQARGIQS